MELKLIEILVKAKNEPPLVVWKRLATSVVLICVVRSCEFGNCMIHHIKRIMYIL